MTARSGTKEDRVFFLDDLRTIIIVLVVVYHAGGVYESTGAWASFWIVDDPATNAFSGLLGLVLDIFLMATMFFISGYFTPASLNDRTAWKFIKGKFRRLALPWIIAVLTLVPLYKVIFLRSRNLPQEDWLTYFHISSPTSQNWLWFLPVLLLFNLLYLAISKSGIRLPRVSLRTAAIGIFLVGWAYSTGMDLLDLRGWTLTWLIDFQNERLLIYFMFFLFGALCGKRGAFDAKPGNKRLYTVVNAVSWIPITIYAVFLIFPLLNPGEIIVSKILDRVILWLFFQISLFCLVFTMIETFWRYRNKEGKLSRELNRNSYYVYIIHLIVLGGLASSMLDTAMPSLSKHLVLVVATLVASNLIISLSRSTYARGAVTLSPSA
jgi:hypothetical protein